MQNILHRGAKTTPKIRKEIHDSPESLMTLAQRYNLNFKTILKWKHREDFADKPSGAIKPKSVLSDREQGVICEFRRITKLPLDDVYVALKDKIPALTRSNLYRCSRRFGYQKLPKDIPLKKERQSFKTDELGFIHLDIASLYTDEGKAYLFVALERKTRLVYAELYTKMDIKNTSLFLQHTIAHFPFKITKILTDNGVQFTYRLLAKHLQPKDSKLHPFDQICIDHDIEHRQTQFKHPWTNGLVERMNQTIKKATIQTYFYEDLEELKKHLMLWLLMYNHQTKLKSLDFTSPYDKLIEEYESNPILFSRPPIHELAGLNRKVNRMKNKYYIFFAVLLTISCCSPKESNNNSKYMDEYNNEYKKWRVSVEGMPAYSKTTAYVNTKEYRDIVSHGKKIIPFLYKKIKNNDGLDFILSLAVVEIMKWPQEQFPINNMTLLRQNVLKKLEMENKSQLNK